MNRRSFVLSAGTAAASSAAIGANDRVRAGIIGSGGRGRLLTAEFKEVGAEMAAVCDVYQPNLEAGLKAANTGAKSFSDYRRMLEDKSLDAVVVATPDHWHARMVIDAVNAGKDVYVEKPMCHKIEEGLEMVEVVRRTKRVVQVGMQRRSSPLFIAARDVANSGVLGEVRLVTSWWLNRQDGLSSATLKGPLDWKQWLGTAPQLEMSSQRFFNWYYYWDYSGGLLIGQAAHVVDAIQWFMNSTHPVAVTCSGGRVNLPGAEIPETASIIIEYPENYMATFTLGYKAMRYPTSLDQMKQFHGSKARLDVGREGFRLFPEQTGPELKAVKEDIQPGSFGPATRQHIRNFLECTKSRKDPNAPVEAGLATAIVLCMTLDSLRSGRRLRWNAETRRVES
ncbi:Gfo/Idh/MocA family oxidoreductase [uncultured Paludibaculum sp.]|uniref:Gfo/Idh/MocA family protein n=1 Tax=uncultured Paludibaculum sp. TaxID=1765020 RepID=UPI002AAC1C9D|nr:Gfo/Idh/MocA family oxidoreductase [uncultured Paludibaculum sp.]